MNIRRSYTKSGKEIGKFWPIPFQSYKATRTLTLEGSTLTKSWSKFLLISAWLKLNGGGTPKASLTNWVGLTLSQWLEDGWSLSNAQSSPQVTALRLQLREQ
ncbi:hypothetical protein AHAS_Ahas14G0126900 [Arachis hypogaea]